MKKSESSREASLKVNMTSSGHSIYNTACVTQKDRCTTTSNWKYLYWAAATCRRWGGSSSHFRFGYCYWAASFRGKKDEISANWTARLRDVCVRQIPACNKHATCSTYALCLTLSLSATSVRISRTFVAHRACDLSALDFIEFLWNRWFPLDRFTFSIHTPARVSVWIKWERGYYLCRSVIRNKWSNKRKKRKP